MTSGVEECVDSYTSEYSNTTTGTLINWAKLAPITDHKSWFKQIHQNGNKPEDWLQYLIFVEENWSAPNKNEKLHYLDHVYRKARESIPLENNHNNVALATIFINSADVKVKLQLVGKARYLLRFARANFRSLPRVHLVAAQFELDQGDKDKCLLILEKANVMYPKDEQFTEAIRRARAGDNILDDPITSRGKVFSNLSKLAPANLTASSEVTETSKVKQPEEAEISNGGVVSNLAPANLTASSEVTETSKVKQPEEAEISNGGAFKHWNQSAFAKVASNTGKVSSASNTSQVVNNIESTPAQSSRSTPYSKGILGSIDRFNPASGFKRPGSTTKLLRAPQRVMRQKLVMRRGSSEDDDDDDDDEVDGKLENSIKPLEESPPDRTTDCKLPPSQLSAIAEDGDSGITVETPPTDDLRETSTVPKFSFLSGPCTAPRRMEIEEVERPSTQGRTGKEDPSHNSEKPRNDEAYHRPIQKPLPPPVTHIQPTPHIQSTPHIQQAPHNKLAPHIQPAPHIHAVPQVQPQPTIPETSERKKQIYIKGIVYSIIKVIGKGGSSKVYQVLHEVSKKIFAVKYVDLECADDLIIQSYKNEITVLQRLQSKEPIIKLYDYEIAPSHIYLVMECGSIDLASFLRKKRVQQEDILFYWRQMLMSVQCIHDEGIIHRDLKPANFLFVEGRLKLIDFGIANSIQSDRTSVTRESQVGTLNYMSPETIQNSGESHGGGSSRMKINCKSDVWSLGCMLYYITYGKTPFQSITNTMMKLQAICNPDYKIQFPDVKDQNLINVLKSCLIRDVTKRPSISELLNHPYVTQKTKSTESPKPAIGMTSSEVQNLMSRLSNTTCTSPRSLELAMALQKYLGAHHEGPQLGKENRKPLHDVNNISQTQKENNPMSLFFSS